MSNTEVLCLSLNPEDCAKHKGTLVGPNGTEWPLADVLACVPEGWRALVQALIADLWGLGWSGHLLQAKEKFGGLRFYVGSELNEVHQRIQQAEDESCLTCQCCGGEGELVRAKGWLSTLCSVCENP